MARSSCWEIVPRDHHYDVGLRGFDNRFTKFTGVPTKRDAEHAMRTLRRRYGRHGERVAETVTVTTNQEGEMAKARKQARKGSKPRAANKQGAKRQQWSLGVFKSASNDGKLVTAYTRTDGTISPYLASRVKTKKALFHSTYTGVSYAEARAQLTRDATKAGVANHEPKAKSKSKPKSKAKSKAKAKAKTKVNARES